MEKARKDYSLAAISQSILLIQLGEEFNPYFATGGKELQEEPCIACGCLCSLSSRGPCNLHLFPQATFTDPFDFKKVFYFPQKKKKKINKTLISGETSGKKSHQILTRRRVVCFKKEEKKWHLITYSSSLKIHVSLFSAWNIFKSPLTTSQLSFPLCLDLVHLSPIQKAQSQSENCSEDSFLCCHTALILLQTLTTRTLTRALLVNKQRNNIFHWLSLWATVHVARPGNAGEHPVALPSPLQQEQGCDNYPSNLHSSKAML